MKTAAALLSCLVVLTACSSTEEYGRRSLYEAQQQAVEECLADQGLSWARPAVYDFEPHLLPYMTADRAELIGYGGAIRGAYSARPESLRVNLPVGDEGTRIIDALEGGCAAAGHEARARHADGRPDPYSADQDYARFERERDLHATERYALWSQEWGACMSDAGHEPLDTTEYHHRTKAWKASADAATELLRGSELLEPPAAGPNLEWFARLRGEVPEFDAIFIEERKLASADAACVIQTQRLLEAALAEVGLEFSAR